MGLAGGPLLVAGVWVQPFALSVALVYLHPLMALSAARPRARRSHPAWRPAYHACLPAIPLLLGVLFWRLHDAPPLAGTDPVSVAIEQHAGDWFLTGVSNHFLVAAHTFLETVHYGVWVLAHPAGRLPLEAVGTGHDPGGPARRRLAVGVTALLLVGLLVVVVLWACFLLDYGTTRYVYFVVALLHVLAEVPFLLRMV